MFALSDSIIETDRLDPPQGVVVIRRGRQRGLHEQAEDPESCDNLQLVQFVHDVHVGAYPIRRFMPTCKLRLAVFPFEFKSLDLSPGATAGPHLCPHNWKKL